MAINSTTRITTAYTSGNNFVFAFKVYKEEDVKVIQVNTSTKAETVLTLTTNYTVTLNDDQNDNPGGTVTLVDGTEGRGYHRFVAGATNSASGQSMSSSAIVNVAANSIYDLRFGMSKQALATQKLRTMPTGTSFLVEAIN